MLTATQKQTVSSLVTAVRGILKTEQTKGAALRKEMMALTSSDALEAFVKDVREEVKATVEDAKLSARVSALVSTIASQVRKDKGWPKLRKAGAGRKADADEQDKDAGKESASEGMIAAVAYIVRRHREISKADLAKLLQPLVPVIRYSAEK